MSAVLHRIGFALRETGQALERTACVLQGINTYEEEVTRLVNVAGVGLKVPSVSERTWVAPTAAVVGEVKIGDSASIWYNCVIRGDAQPVTIGRGTNLQDGVYVGTLLSSGLPTTIGNYVSVGHRASIRGAIVEDYSLIGMGAVLEEGSKVESGAIVAAGAVVPAGTVVPSGELWAGNPATKLRDLRPKEQQYLKDLPSKYFELSGEHKSVLKLVDEYMARAGHH